MVTLYHVMVRRCQDRGSARAASVVAARQIDDHARRRTRSSELGGNPARRDRVESAARSQRRLPPAGTGGTRRTPARSPRSGNCSRSRTRALRASTTYSGLMRNSPVTGAGSIGCGGRRAGRGSPRSSARGSRRAPRARRGATDPAVRRSRRPRTVRARRKPAARSSRTDRGSRRATAAGRATGSTSANCACG